MSTDYNLRLNVLVVKARDEKMMTYLLLNTSTKMKLWHICSETDQSGHIHKSQSGEAKHASSQVK